MSDIDLSALATDARINERLIARGMDPMKGPVLSQILREATGESLSSREALASWGADRLSRDRRVRAVLKRYASRV